MTTILQAETQQTLAEVVRKISALSKTLDELDARISSTYRRIEDHLRRCGLRQLIWVPYNGHEKLAWARRRSAHEYWRFVVQVEDGVEEVLSLPRKERADLIQSPEFALLIARAREALRR
jgi:hypothetical protein